MFTEKTSNFAEEHVPNDPYIFHERGADIHFTHVVVGQFVNYGSRKFGSCVMAL